MLTVSVSSYLFLIWYFYLVLDSTSCHFTHFHFLNSQKTPIVCGIHAHTTHYPEFDQL